MDPTQEIIKAYLDKWWMKHWESMMGGPPTPSTIPKWFSQPTNVPQPASEPPSPTLKLDKGDYCQLKTSKRKFRIMDERKDDQQNFEELCKFDDDNRNPIWLPHSWLVGEVNILEKA